VCKNYKQEWISCMIWDIFWTIMGDLQYKSIDILIMDNQLLYARTSPPLPHETNYLKRKPIGILFGLCSFFQSYLLQSFQHHLTSCQNIWNANIFLRFFSCSFSGTLWGTKTVRKTLKPISTVKAFLNESHKMNMTITKIYSCQKKIIIKIIFQANWHYSSCNDDHSNHHIDALRSYGCQGNHIWGIWLSFQIMTCSYHYLSRLGSKPVSFTIRWKILLRIDLFFICSLGIN
jgi:hypothetical protein